MYLGVPSFVHLLVKADCRTSWCSWMRTSTPVPARRWHCPWCWQDASTIPLPLCDNTSESQVLNCRSLLRTQFLDPDACDPCEAKRHHFREGQARGQAKRPPTALQRLVGKFNFLIVSQ